MLTVHDRAAAYNAAYPNYPPLVTTTDSRWLYGVWEIGNNYRNKTSYYGAFPPRFLDRLMALFPDITRREQCLHVFSGSLPASVRYFRLDSHQPAEYRCTVADYSQSGDVNLWDLQVADPPYTVADAARYGTPMVDRRKTLRALASVASNAGNLAWLDTVKPMYRKADWRLWGEIAVVRSTNHRVRMLFLFERTAQPLDG